MISKVTAAPTHGPRHQPPYLAELKRHPLFRARTTEDIASVASQTHENPPTPFSKSSSIAPRRQPGVPTKSNLPRTGPSAPAIDIPCRSWSTEAAREPQRTAEISRVMSEVAEICNAANDKVQSLSNTKLSLDLSRAFGGILFSPEDLRAWRSDIGAVARNATLFAENHRSLVGFVTSEKHLSNNGPIPRKIASFMQEHPSVPSLLITNSLLEKGDGNAIIQFIRAIARGVHRPDALVFPMERNQDATTLRMNPTETRRQLEAFYRAVSNVNVKLARGIADAEIDRAAVEVGSEFPSSLIASSSAPKAPALKAFHRDAKWTEKVLKSNCDSLVQYVLRSAIPDSRIAPTPRR
jgi:hypothetical protein